jgi:hypothetical protein
MEINLKEQFILDTSAFISLETCNLLRDVIKYSKIITTKAVMAELIEFSKHNDTYGKIAQRVLIFKNRFLKLISEVLRAFTIPITSFLD